MTDDDTPRDDQEHEPDDAGEPEFISDPVFASWSRMIRLAKTPGDKLVALGNAAAHAAGPVRKGLREKPRVVDDLMSLAGMYDEVAIDDVQRVLAEKFSNGQANGRAKKRDPADIGLEEGVDALRYAVDHAEEIPFEEETDEEREQARAKPSGRNGGGADQQHDYAERFDPEREPEPPPLPYIDMSTWDSVDPPPREWLVENYIPMRQPTLISGEGAIGKSILLLQLLAATSLRDKWFDLLMPTPGPTIYLGAEDDQDELHRRLAAILAHHGARFSDLIEGGFKPLAFAGKDAVLATFDRSTGRIKPTPLFKMLYREACALHPKCIVLDTVSDVFLGDEIKRDQVRQFGSLMRKLAIDSGSAPIISSHPSLSGIKSGSGMSGSTQWHNTVRARAYFRKPGSKNDDAESVDDGKPDDGRRELQFMKNQYGPLSQVIKLKWSRGLWLPISETAEAQFSVEDLFLTLLRRFAGQDRDVSPNKSPSYAPAKFAEQPEAKAAKASAKMFAAAMERLLSTNRIRVAHEGPKSRRTTKIIEVEGAIQTDLQTDLQTTYEPLPTASDRLATHTPRTPHPSLKGQGQSEAPAPSDGVAAEGNTASPTTPSPDSENDNEA
jgi:RecA-family ATPase